MAYSRTLHPLLCTTRDTESLLLAFVASFNALIADSSSLSASEITDLDHYGDGSIGFDDRDYWLNWIINRDWTIVDRLPFADSTPSSYADSDPLGLRFDTDGVTLRPNVTFLDPLNSSRVYINESSNNTCWLDESRTISAFPTFPSANLFTPATTGTTYNYKVWGDFRCYAETPTSTSRRFPDSTAPCASYIRGGSYTLDREIQIIKQSGVTNNPSSIDIRPYPGEKVHVYMGSRKTSTDPAPQVFNNSVMVTLSRPDLHIDESENLIFHGYRESGGNRIFGPLMFSVTNAADRFRFTATARDCRAIAPNHPDAATLPEYVDYAFDYRSTLSSGDSTSRMLTYLTMLINENNDGSLIEGATFHPVDDDIPPSVSVPGGSTEEGHGDTLDIQGATNLTIRRSTFSGTASHSQIRIVESSGNVTPTGLLLEYNDMRNPENNVLLLSNCDNSIIRYNRIYDFANRQDLVGNDGYGIQPSDGTGNQIVDNAIWLGATQGSGPNYGIAVQVAQSGATSWTNNEIKRNAIYGCGIFLGYNSGTPSTDLAKITGNTIEDNVIDGLSDYNNTQTSADGPIVLNIGPHPFNANGNVIQNNIIRRTDGDTTMVVERYYPSATTDHTIADQSPWFVGNESVDPEFSDPANGDFSLRNSSPAFTMLANVPQVDADLDSEPYDCTLVPQYLPRMDVYSGRVIKNLSAVPALLLAFLLAAAGAEANQGSCERGRDSSDAGRLWNVDRGIVFLVDGVVADFANNNLPVKKFVRVSLDFGKWNDGGEANSVDEIGGFRGGNRRPCSADLIPLPHENVAGDGIKLESVNGGDEQKRFWVVNFPVNRANRQFWLPVKRHSEKNVVGRLAVDRGNGFDGQFSMLAGQVADVGNHPGRLRSNSRDTNQNDENCSFHKNQSSRLAVGGRWLAIHASRGA